MSDPRLAAFEALPVFAGYVWRVAAGEVTVPFDLTGLAPASRRVRVATENFTSTEVLLFVVRRARDIAPFSARPADAEVVLMPGAQMVPATAAHEVAGLRVQVIIELPPQGEPLPLVPDDATIAQWIAAARAEPEVEVVSPGRFGALPPAP